MGIRITVDDKALRAQLKRFEREFPAAVAGAVNRAATAAQTEAQRALRQDMNVKAATIKARMKLDRAKRGYPVATITVKGDKLRMTEFIGTRQTRTGASVKLVRNKPRTKFASGFIAKIRTHSVFQRISQAGKLVGRGPLKALLGPSVAVRVSQPSIMRRVVARARNVLEQRIAHEIRRRTT